MSKTYTQDQVDFVKMSSKVDSIEKTVTRMAQKLEAEYVTKDELEVLNVQFQTVQKIVYGIVTLILTAFVVALSRLVIQ